MGKTLSVATRAAPSFMGARALGAGTLPHLQLGVRSLFIEVEETPNPSSLKFLTGETVLPEEFGAAMEFRRGDNTTNSPLVTTVFRIGGVQGVFLGPDFVTVSKDDQVPWEVLKPEVFAAIMDAYSVDEAIVTGPQVKPEELDDGEEDSEIVMLIKELLEERIRPMVHEDGGDIFFHGFDEQSGIVTVQLAGSCAGCPSSTVTLKSGVENMLMHYIPEIKAVEALGEDDDPNARKLSFHPST